MGRHQRNSSLDSLVQVDIAMRDRQWSSFRACGYAGMAAAVTLGVLLTRHQGLSLWMLAAIALTAVSAFLALAMATKLVVGEEVLIYYHHELAILGVTALLLRLVGQPVLPYLDVTILGLGIFLCFGRIGCFLVGCCHGRPHSWGVCYGGEHVEAGFTHYYSGVRLFPVQLLESLWVLATVAMALLVLVTGNTPGEALAWCAISYGVGRFCLEFIRGDADRPYWRGFSEAQWTSLVLMSLVVVAEARGALPFRPLHVAATAGVAVAMIMVAARRRRDSLRHLMLHPRHIREVATVLERIVLPTAEGVAVTRTTAGIRLSAGRIDGQGDSVRHYTFSSGDGRLAEADAQILAELILDLQHHTGASQLLHGENGIFHLLTGEPTLVKTH